MGWLTYFAVFVAGVWCMRWVSSFRAARFRRRLKYQYEMAAFEHRHARGTKGEKGGSDEDLGTGSGTQDPS